MNKKTRLLILLGCVALFLVVAPYLVIYSMGYRIDFQTWKITATGGIYVRTYPQASEIIFNNKDSKKPSIFSNSSVFVQDLLPKQHTVLIKKDEYFDYYKKLDVKEKEVTKLESVVLFKNTTVYNEIATQIISFYISPDKQNILLEGSNTKSLDFYYFNISDPQNKKKYSFALPYTSVLDIIWADDSTKALIKTQNSSGIVLYYLLNFSAKTQSNISLSSFSSSTINTIIFNPQNSNQYFYINKNTLFTLKDKKITTLFKNVASYKISNGNIIWLSLDGKLNQSDISGKNNQILLAEWPLNKNYINPIKYKIEIISGKILLSGPDFVYEYNEQEKNLKDLGPISNNFKLLQSPDNKNMVYYNNSEIYLYAFEPSPYNKNAKNNTKLFSAKNGEIISNCYWLNNDYIIFESGNKIIVSEIDFRGNINQNELQNSWPPNPDSKNPKFIFNSSDNKLYILTNETLYSSEKLVP